MSEWRGAAYAASYPLPKGGPMEYLIGASLGAMATLIAVAFHLGWVRR